MPAWWSLFTVYLFCFYMQCLKHKCVCQVHCYKLFNFNKSNTDGTILYLFLFDQKYVALVRGYLAEKIFQRGYITEKSLRTTDVVD